ncbi:aryl-sulfate sulfotransferase [Chitinophaga ginsengisegetis]|uniref:aryl-sulfate sulfotransferase n=1 Tax=Chitinophaga ginsengisegetis TaxID=393003 RepID=UPI000DB9AF25|nr:aryl-sulfate sulfotransferase [Chitinophaga ginsengisegetis]MDR6569420.1 WD40 repeat protein [Chitinophaga ginsengisegetis]MDR6649153.1 WD40 repeat protein [Chitinophaga ginsengisegetis]MDR6655503.1 WD40 repeat protein [Chitinophaga ginsengisegetis]
MIKLNKIQRLLPLLSMAAALLLFAPGCMNSGGNDIVSITLNPQGQNAIKVKTDILCTDTVDAAVEYWPKEQAQQRTTTPLSKHRISHTIVLTNLLPGKAYEYRILTGHGKDLYPSKTYTFNTSGFPVWMKDMFSVVCPDSSVLPATFRKGYVMLTRREDPGVLFLLNAKGDVTWYHQVSGTGFKVAKFTDNNTFLTLLGGPGYETSYGDQILELSLSGDTLANLKKGQQDFKQTIHHEILLNPNNEFVTLCVEERICDLSSKGGSKQDTVRGDGILVLNRQGKQVWKWTVFDALNPLDDKNILKEKQDWMHANCIAFDKDGNYLISFYNNGQIWKIDARTGKRLWTFGKNGDFDIPAEALFDQAHGLHINEHGELMFFDNGVSKKTSRTLSFKLDENTKQAQLRINTLLPRENYNERMGSSYLVGDTTLLQCATKRNTVILTNFQGRFLWLLRTGMSSYRASFIPAERLAPYIIQPGY